MSLKQRQNSIKDAISIATDNVQHGLTEDILAKVVLESIKMYQEKLNVGVQDSLSDLLDTFKHKISEEIFDVSDSWKVPKTDAYLFPRNCRFCYQRGYTTIMIIEQSPLVRTIRMQEGVFSFEINNRSRNGIIRGSLSLPYVLFFIVANSSPHSFEQTINLYTAWRISPLTSLNDDLYHCLLPNTHENLMVCTGQDYDGINNAEDMINDYWNSSFNNDLSEHWWTKGTCHRDLTSGLRWQTISEENPMFALSFVLDSTGKTVNDMIEFLTNGEETPDQSDLRHRLSNQIDSCIESLFSKVMKYFKKTKFERHSPKDISNNLKEAMSEVSGEMSDILLVLNQEVDKLTKSVQEERGDSFNWKPVGSSWQQGGK